MKIYVVMKGEYSDRHVVGVTVDKEIAETMAERFTENPEYGYDSCHIEEYEDAAEFIDARHVYEIAFYPDGTYEVCQCNDYEDYDWQNACQKKVSQYRTNGTIWINCLANDSEHAFKIACDRKTEYLAEKEGII